MKAAPVQLPPAPAVAVVPEAAAGLRFDLAMAQMFPQLSRSAAKQAIEAGLASLNDAIVRPRDRVHAGDIVRLTRPPAGTTAWRPEPVPVDIVYHDEALIVVNKPAGLVTHPGAGNPAHTLMNGIMQWDPGLEHLPRCGMIHRLDKDTSGLLLVARTALAHRVLTARMQHRDIQREYVAIVNGVVIAGGRADAPLARHRVHRTRMAVAERGRQAVTHYRVLERFRAHSHLALQLETGRTHQIRVHMAHLGFPLVGDATYGGRVRLPKNPTPALTETLSNFKRQALHAARLSLQHPVTDATLEWHVDPPADFQQLLAVLRADQQRNTAG